MQVFQQNKYAGAGEMLGGMQQGLMTMIQGLLQEQEQKQHTRDVSDLASWIKGGMTGPMPSTRSKDLQDMAMNLLGKNQMTPEQQANIEESKARAAYYRGRPEPDGGGDGANKRLFTVDKNGNYTPYKIGDPVPPGSRVVSPSGISQTVNVGDKPAGKEYYDDLDKAATSYENVEEIIGMMGEGGGGASTVGLENQLMMKVKNPTGMLSPEEQVFKQRYAQLWTVIRQLHGSGLISDKDIDRLSGAVPSLILRDPAFIAGMNDLKKQTYSKAHNALGTLEDLKYPVPLKERYERFRASPKEIPASEKTGFESLTPDELLKALSEAQKGQER